MPLLLNSPRSIGCWCMWSRNNDGCCVGHSRRSAEWRKVELHSTVFKSLSRRMKTRGKKIVRENWFQLLLCRVEYNVMWASPMLTKFSKESQRSTRRRCGPLLLDSLSLSKMLFAEKSTTMLYLVRPAASSNKSYLQNLQLHELLNSSNRKTPASIQQQQVFYANEK